ncbi:MAG: hypothetical protein WBA77_13095 [Microcoleaceae cyanobacterium]
MKSDLIGLRFYDNVLNELTGISLSDSLIGYLCQNRQIQDIFTGNIKQNKKQLFSLVYTELIILFLTFILSIPISLIVINQAQLSPSSAQTLFYLLQISTILSLVMTAGFNLFLRWKIKPFIPLIKLLEEIHKYHEVLKAVDILDQLVAAGNLHNTVINREAVINALNITRESLVCAFKTERIFRENQDFMTQRYELFARLEQHLTTLMALDVTNKGNEYGQLLNEALEIGMSVHQAVRKL